MGNAPSSQANKSNGGLPPERPNTASPSPTTPQLSQQQQHHNHQHYYHHSSHSLPHNTVTRPLGNVPASAARPYQTFESASAQHTSQSRASATDVLRSQTHSATHSPTTAVPIRKIVDPNTHPSSQHTSKSSTPVMGQSESRIKSVARSTGSAGSTPPPARPIDVSVPIQNKRVEVIQSPRDAQGSYMLTTDFTRPPRLPLPISGNTYTPGSPIISPQDLEGPIEYISDLPRSSSLLTGTTLDDDDSGSDRGDDLTTVRGGVLPPVPTTVDWLEGGDRVYVTGTFADWDNKYRLSATKDGKHSITLKLQPGTYHLRFIVDGDMVLSRELPTAVDFTNCLVNYLEVVPETNPATAGGEPYVPPHLEQGTTQPIPVKRPQDSVQSTETSSHQQPPPTPELHAVLSPSSIPPEGSAPARADLPIQIVPERLYTTKTPQFFQDVEADAEASEDQNEDYWRSVELTRHLPSPPTLPGFLTKSIHNMHTPVKDDASVLANPNHTVLNHLTTSSIKGGVIATSMTTRYGRKFLTTILYKPTQPNS